MNDVISTFMQLDKLYEAKCARREIIQDFLYNTVDNIMEKDDPIFSLINIDPAEMLDAFEAKGMIRQPKGMITIPAGTKVTYKKSVDFDNTTFDIFYIPGAPKAMFAVDVHSDLDNIFVDIN